VPTVDELERTLGRLRRIAGVARTHTTVVLSTRFEGRANNAGLADGPPAGA
jgi:Lrp/AsnC family leucine-responsive transcriptional regulator